MTSIKKNRAYSSPIIERIILDNEISLALQSGPPGAPPQAPDEELIIQAPSYFENDPFKTNIG